MRLPIPRGSLPVALAATAAIFLIHSGCGILGVGVALPQAIASNSNFSIKGEVVDAHGAPLDDVKIHIDHSHIYWDAWMGTASHDESKDEKVSKKFNFPWLRGDHVALVFSKAGLVDQRIELTAAGYIQPTGSGAIWPKDKPVRVTLFPAAMPVPALRWGRATISYADYPAQEVIPLAGASGGISAGPRIADLSAPPAGALYVELLPAAPAALSDHKLDPLDVALPARLTLHIAQGAGGFVRFTPTPGTAPMDQMAQAPESGYTDGLTLDAKRLRQMRQMGEKYILEGHEYFYFQAGGKFGKGWLSWAPPENQPECRLMFSLYLQPDGSTNLLTLPNKP